MHGEQGTTYRPVKWIFIPEQKFVKILLFGFVQNGHKQIEFTMEP
jgi:hypothetical protein